MGSLKKNCKTFGCRNLHNNPGGYCDECMARYAAAHPKAPAEDRRPSAQKRGYDHRWQKFARAFLLEHPKCAICGAPARCVDHKYTPADVMLQVNGGTFDYDEREYQALCISCNNRKGYTVDRRRREQYKADLVRLGLDPGGGSEKIENPEITGAASAENRAGGKK